MPKATPPPRQKRTTSSANSGGKRTSNRRRVAQKKASAPSSWQLYFPLHWLWKYVRPHKLLLSCLCCCLAIGYGSYAWATHSSRFLIQDLHLVGNQRLSKAEVQSLLQIGPHSNIFKVNIFKVKLGALEKSLESSPWVVSAELNRTLPNRLDIEIVERKAIAIVRLGHLYLLSDKGVPFKRVSIQKDGLSGLSVITGISRDDYNANSKQSEQAFLYASQALEAFSQKPSRPQIGEVHIDKEGGLSLMTFENAMAIHIGHPEAALFSDRYHSYDLAWQALDEEERTAARSFRIPDTTPSDRVTIAFAGNEHSWQD